MRKKTNWFNKSHATYNPVQHVAQRKVYIPKRKEGLNINHSDWIPGP